MLDEDIEKVIAANDIEVTVVKTETNPFISVSQPGDVHKYCTLSGRGVEGFDFYITHTPDLTPSVTQCLSVLIQDIKVYKGCEGYEDFLRVFGLSQDEDRAVLQVCWSELERLSPMVEQLHELAAREVSTPAALGMN